MKNFLKQDLKALKQTITTSSNSLYNAFNNSVKILVDALKFGNKILICGNGGSASDAEHMAGEIVGRFGFDRKSLPCISLCTPSATFTAISNDYGYENVFARQLTGLGKTGDVLIGISTSGNSGNVVKAMQSAKDMKVKTIALTGSKDSKLSEIADITLRSPSSQTPRIQEIHGIIIHSLCRAIEELIFPEKAKISLPDYKLISNNELDDFAKAISTYQTVFTNGCFDILHPGHVYLLEKCREAGEILIVGLNTDSSIKRLKGEARPYHSFEDRAKILSALEFVDYIVGFSDDTPKHLIETLSPKVLIKGGDYTKETVVGSKWVESYGGKVVIVPTLAGHSTTEILKRNG